MSALTDLLTGLAQKIHAAGINIEWNQSGLYTPGQTGIYMMTMPPTPDRAVALFAVPQGDDPSMPLGKTMVQVRSRGLPGQPLDVLDLSDSMFAVLHGTTDLPFGSITVIQMNRRISTPLGTDDLKRTEWVDQYYLDCDYPPTINRPVGGSW